MREEKLVQQTTVVSGQLSRSLTHWHKVHSLMSQGDKPLALSKYQNYGMVNTKGEQQFYGFQNQQLSSILWSKFVGKTSAELLHEILLMCSVLLQKDLSEGFGFNSTNLSINFPLRSWTNDTSSKTCLFFCDDVFINSGDVSSCWYGFTNWCTVYKITQSFHTQVWWSLPQNKTDCIHKIGFSWKLKECVEIIVKNTFLSQVNTNRMSSQLMSSLEFCLVINLSEYPLNGLCSHETSHRLERKYDFLIKSV